MSAPTKAAALKLYARACETHKRADWRLACHALATLLGADAPAQREPAKPVSLIPFLANAGGLADPGGELSARDAEIWHKGRPFQKRLVRDDGRTLEHAAEAAWEAGYFPDACGAMDDAQPVSEADLIAAIDAELAGRPRYAVQDQDAEVYA